MSASPAPALRPLLTPLRAVDALDPGQAALPRLPVGARGQGDQQQTRGDAQDGEQAELDEQPCWRPSAQSIVLFVKAALPCAQARLRHSPAGNRRRSPLRAGLARPLQHPKHRNLYSSCFGFARRESAEAFFKAPSLLGPTRYLHF